MPGSAELSRILQGLIDDYSPESTVDFILCEDAANAVYQLNAIKAEISRVVAEEGLQAPSLKNIYAYLNVQRLAFTRSIRILDARRPLPRGKGRPKVKNETDSAPKPPVAEIFKAPQPFAVDSPSKRPFNFTRRNG